MDLTIEEKALAQHCVRMQLRKMKEMWNNSNKLEDLRNYFNEYIQNGVSTLNKLAPSNMKCCEICFNYYTQDQEGTEPNTCAECMPHEQGDVE